MDKTKFPLRAALWVHDVENDAWRLWLVPERSDVDKREFYGVVWEASPDREAFIGMDLSLVRLVRADHPAIRALSRWPSISDIPEDEGMILSHNMLDGFFLEEGIVLRLTKDIAETTAA